MGDRAYQCCFCKKGMAPIGGDSHRLDPCALVIIGNWVSPPELQLSQHYFCHLECFKAQIGETRPLYIEEMEPGDQADAAQSGLRRGWLLPLLPFSMNLQTLPKGNDTASLFFHRMPAVAIDRSKPATRVECFELLSNPDGHCRADPDLSREFDAVTV